MPVIVSCPECGTKLRVPDTAVGKRVKCSKCATAFVAEPPAEDAGVQAAPPERPAPPEEPVSARKPARRRDEERFRRRDDGGVSTLIPYRNGRALAAYYCGVFSFIPCLGLILGPIALVLGILGLRFVKAHPSAKGTGHAIAGIICGSITTLGNWGFFLLMVVAMVLGAATGK
jgi:predicted Zn finger-like uncharacterized protein